MFYEVVVGNVGPVYNGNDSREALLMFNTYVDRSESGHGRCSGEYVVLFENGMVSREHRFYGSMG